MVFLNLSKFSFLIVQSVVAVLSASYYQKEYSSYLFTTSSEYRNQTDAQNWCNRNGSQLLAITNSSIQSAVVAFINDARQQGRLGYYNIITDGQRTIDNWRWINDTSTSLLALEILRNDEGYPFSYVYVYTATSGYTLNAARPSDTNRYYICEFAGQTSCSNGYLNGGQCFQSFANEYVTWFQARNRCLLQGGDLATFEFMSANNDLSMLNGSWLIQWREYWIGLRRQWWTWETINSDVTFSQWADGQPVYFSNDPIDCLCLEPNDWKWTTWRCTGTAQFVCIRASSSSVATTTANVGKPGLTTTSVISSNQSPSTLDNFTPQSSSSTLVIQNETKALSSSNSDKDRLAIGVGVGVGGGVLLLIILVIVLILLSRKGYISFSRKSTTPKDTSSSSSSPPPPDVIGTQPPNTIYAPICPSNEGFQDDIDSNQTTAEYAPLQIVTYSKHHTLPPPAVSGPSNTEL